MTAPGNSVLLIVLLVLFVACTGYAGGRLHQWYRTGLDRDDAYRDGYDTATRSVFSLAARMMSPRRDRVAAIRASAAVVVARPDGAPEPAAAVRKEPGLSTRRRRRSLRNSKSSAVLHPSELAPHPAAPAAAPGPGPTGEAGRHLVPDELVEAPTYRLAADRVARARVPGAGEPDDEPTTHLPTTHLAVPKPRGSEPDRP